MTKLTAETLRSLSPGACKILKALDLEADASDARLMQLTGYKPRWFMRLKGELISSGILAKADKEEQSQLSGAALTAFDALLSVGVERETALKLAATHAPDDALRSVEYVRGRSDIDNPAGYVIARLRKMHPRGGNGSAGAPPGGGSSSLSTVGGTPTKRAASPFVGSGSPTSLVGEIPPVGSNPPATQDSHLLPVSSSSPASPSLTATGDPDFQLLLYTLCAACGCDPLLCPEALDDADRLWRADYRAGDVERFVRQVWPTMWPGNKGEPPTRGALLQHIGYLKGGRANESAGNPYLADPYFERETDRPHAEPPPDPCPHCGQASCTCAKSIPPRVRDGWIATLSQLRLQLYRTTYDAWVRGLKLAAYDDSRVFVIAPHAYAKDYINRHLLPAMTRALNDYCFPTPPANSSRRVRQDREIAIVIETADGSCRDGTGARSGDQKEVYHATPT